MHIILYEQTVIEYAHAKSKKIFEKNIDLTQ